MKRFELRVKLFTIDQRRQGKTWGEIRRDIRTEFGIDPPGVRAMQKWEKELDREGLTLAIAKKTNQEAEASKKYVVNTIVRELIPILWDAKNAGEDIEYASWKWFFSVVESTLGRDKFRAILDKYLEESRGQN
jgi:hypothetical protein